jgi:hypothetical protein
MTFPIYLDEDLPHTLAPFLRSNGVGAIAAREAETLGWDDPDQLARATSMGRAILSGIRHDFSSLATLAVEDDHPHAGIIITFKRISYGTFRQVADALTTLEALYPEGIAGVLICLDDLWPDD